MLMTLRLVVLRDDLTRAGSLTPAYPAFAWGSIRLSLRVTAPDTGRSKRRRLALHVCQSS